MEKLPSIIHESWHSHLLEVFQTEELKRLNYEVLPNCIFYPEANHIFRVFSMPLEKIRVVILGQDPYSNKGEAIGYSFAVAEGVPKPFSLRAIEKEVGGELDSTLKHWTEQGVFLFNTALTVEHKKPNSHSALWSKFTKKVIDVIATEVQPVWLLWGLNAISHERLINSKRGNQILKAPHPAAEAYTGGKSGFYGSNHFNKANKLLIDKNTPLINW
jgi:uracil-DNA glycosylase